MHLSAACLVDCVVLCLRLVHKLSDLVGALLLIIIIKQGKDLSETVTSKTFALMLELRRSRYEVTNIYYKLFLAIFACKCLRMQKVFSINLRRRTNLISFLMLAKVHAQNTSQYPLFVIAIFEREIWMVCLFN